MIYAGNGDSYFYAIDVSTGMVKMEVAEQEMLKISSNSPAAAFNGIVYGSDNIYALDAQ